MAADGASSSPRSPTVSTAARAGATAALPSPRRSALNVLLAVLLERQGVGGFDGLLVAIDCCTTASMPMQNAGVRQLQQLALGLSDCTSGTRRSCSRGRARWPTARGRTAACRGLCSASAARIASDRSVVHAPGPAGPRSARSRHDLRPQSTMLHLRPSRSSIAAGSRPNAAVRCWLRPRAALSCGVSSALLTAACSRNTSRNGSSAP